MKEKLVYIVFERDEEGECNDIVGIFAEYEDAVDRKNKLKASPEAVGFKYFIESRTLQ